MAELSVIMPSVQEWPLPAFTCRAIYEELRDRVDFEFIYVDNWCEQSKAQGHPERDRTLGYLESMAKGWPWLKTMAYEEKLSHWNAKRVAVEASTGKFIWFVDAHVIISRDALYKQFCYYRDHHEELNGVLHLPVTYHVMEYRRLMYKLVDELDTSGYLGYSFTNYRPPSDGPTFQVPCMTTDGMMITRELYDYIGGLPKSLGIWGGGENFINFTLAVLGKTVNIMVGDSLNHHGDKRGYSYNFDDLFRNRCTAAYMYGGEELAVKYAANHKGRPSHLKMLCLEVMDECYLQRKMIETRQVIEIREWVKKWKMDNGG